LGPALRRFAPVLVGETLVALNVVVDKVYAALLPEGSVSLLEYADRARVIPMTLFEGSLLIVAFNTWARVPAAERGYEIRRALQWVLLIAPPVLCGLWVGRVVAIQVVFEHGAFGAESTVAVAAAFGSFLPGVLAAMLAGLAVKAHLLADRARLVLALGIVSFAINAGLNAVLLQFGLVGLALSTSLTSWMIAALSLGRLWRELPSGRSWAVPLGILGASVLLALALWIGGIEPTSVADPRLWASALPFVILLGLGLREAQIK
jgi:putative peptidoglycan lipid II flippase